MENYRIDYAYIESLMKKQGYKSVNDWCKVNDIGNASYYISKAKQTGHTLFTVVQYAKALNIKLDDFIIYGDDLND